MAAHILVTVPITLTCVPRTPEAVISASVFLEQAASGRIASGRAFLVNNANFGTTRQFLPGDVVCDNAAHSFTAAILAETAGAPFGQGQSIVTVEITVCTVQGFSQFDCATTTVGPRVITQVEA